MKNVKLILISFWLISFLSCGKRSETQARNHHATSEDFKTETQQEINANKSGEITISTEKLSQASTLTTGENSVFLLEESYFGERLILIYPHECNWGYVKVKDEDAKALFDAMAVKETKGDENWVWLPAEIKQGYDISCYKQARKQKPNDFKYSCSMYIEYLRGEVNNQVDLIEFNSQTPELKESYLSENLTMIYPHNRSWGSYKLKGDDAKALYFTLTVQLESDDEGNPDGSSVSIKSGQNIVCYEQTDFKALDEKEYTCTIYINYKTGRVDFI